MKFYSVDINIAGDRNHVITKHKVSTPEVLVLQAIHGVGSVTNVRPFGAKGIDKTPASDIVNLMGRVYRKTRIGAGNDARPVLVAVFPGWPNAEIPLDLNKTSFDKAFMKSGKDEPDPDHEAALKRAADQEAEIQRQQEEAERKEAERLAEEEAAEKEKADAQAQAKAEAAESKKATSKSSGSKTTANKQNKADDGDGFLE